MSELTASQETFETCYRGRQSALHHAAYMRMGKVLLALDICRRTGISLRDSRIMDYGFGAGTFFRYCDQSCSLAGVELDHVNVRDVQQMLAQRGYPRVDLQAIQIERWSEHPLLQQHYDIFLCSHVLEHLSAPVDFLRIVKRSLAASGKFVGLVPINERRRDPHHVQTVSRQLVHDWARDANMRVVDYIETDHFQYWTQPWQIVEATAGHTIGRAFNLMLGPPATLLGPQIWFALSRGFGVLTASKPTQAAFVLEPINPRND